MSGLVTHGGLNVTYGVFPASSPCLQQAGGCVPRHSRAGETFSRGIHAGSAGSKALPAGSVVGRKAVVQTRESKQGRCKPSQVPTPPVMHRLNHPRLRTGGKKL